VTGLVLAGGTFWSQSAPRVEAVAIAGGRIVAAGTVAEARDAAGAHAKEVDLAGAAVLPGLVDSHVHLLNWGRGELGVRCWPGEVASIADITARVREAAAHAPEGTCLRGRGFDPGRLAEQRAPTAVELDPGGDRLVVLDSMDFHRRVVSPAVLRRAGIGPGTEDPPGGVIVRDAVGNPTGEFVDGARALVEPAIPPWSEAENDQALLAAAHHFVSRGFTRVTNAAPLNMAATGEEVAALGRMATRAQLPIWVRSMLKAEVAEKLHDLGLPEGLALGRLTLAGLKVFADGAFGPRSAWLSAPYADRAEISPRPEATTELAKKIRRAGATGWQVCVHAVGDRAVSDSARWLAELPGTGHRIEHCCLTDRATIRLMGEAGLVPVPQLAFLRERSDTFLDALGEERMHRLYPLREWIDAGLRPLHGSDAPVTRDIRPLPALATAVLRRDSSGRCWGTNQAISPGEALAMATSWPALADGESDRGRIAVGCRADLSVFDRDPRATPPEDWGEIEPVMTIVDGDVAWPP
jgi:predicted amidohydrolase YtcJ